METTMKKYKTIYADPPWEVERGAAYRCKLSLPINEDRGHMCFTSERVVGR